MGVIYAHETKGIIIKSVDYGESDKVITILNEHGAKVPLMVRRAKSQSGFQAHTQLFVYGLFIITNGVEWEPLILLML